MPRPPRRSWCTRTSRARWPTAAWGRRCGHRPSSRGGGGGAGGGAGEEGRGAGPGLGLGLRPGSAALRPTSGATRRRSGSGSPSCPRPRAQPPSPSSATGGTRPPPRTEWTCPCRSETQVGRGGWAGGGSRVGVGGLSQQPLCSRTGFRTWESQAQDEEPRAVLAQKIEKETVGLGPAGPPTHSGLLGPTPSQHPPPPPGQGPRGSGWGCPCSGWGSGG